MAQQHTGRPGGGMLLGLFSEISYIYLDQYSFVMNLKKQKRNLLIAVFIGALCPVAGQAVYDLDFQGVLHDIEGNRVANESFNLNVQLKKPSGSDIWFEFSSVTHSDAEGWFGFQISEVSRYLNGEDPFSDPVLISLEILPNSETEWIEKGGDFKLSYTLSSQSDGEKKTHGNDQDGRFRIVGSFRGSLPRFQRQLSLWIHHRGLPAERSGSS
jgi:hypothetical protein